MHGYLPNPGIARGRQAFQRSVAHNQRMMAGKAWSEQQGGRPRGGKLSSWIVFLLAIGGIVAFFVFGAAIFR